ncbi:MAG: hypothetical protein R3357_07625 [Burkholderiales bacterium]|nr:hypothetical protein [Burkholderiales bacterium]
MTGSATFSAQAFGASPGRLRRSLHACIALAALSFPWLFTSLWPVAALLGASLAASLCLHAPHGLELRSQGARRALRSALCLGGGLCLAFAWSAGNPPAYWTVVLVLVLADGAAALVGRRYGRAQRTLGGARKSAAGSAAFFTVAFAVTAAILVLGADLRVGEALAAAGLVATVSAGLEASFGDGLDNLFVPLGALVALELAGI